MCVPATIADPRNVHVVVYDRFFNVQNLRSAEVSEALVDPRTASLREVRATAAAKASEC